MNALRVLSDITGHLIDFFINNVKPKKYTISELLQGMIQGKMDLDNVVRYLDATKRMCENGDDQSVDCGGYRTCRLADYGLCHCDRVLTKGTGDRKTEGKPEER